MSATIVLDREHIQRAYAQLRKPGWPSLEEMERAYRLYMSVRGQAVSLASGRPLPPEPVAAAPPAPVASVPKPADWPPPPPPRRRRDDGAAPYSSRAAAAGEYVHPDEA